MKACLYVALLVLVILTSSCYNPLIPPDKSILADKPCAPPCYYGLVPGESTREDAERFVKTLRKGELRSLEVFKHSNSTYFSWVGGRSGGILNRIELIQDRISLIRITPDFDLRLGTVVERFGSPEYVLAIFSTGSDMNLYSLEVYYPHKGLAFPLKPKVRDNGQIRPDMAIKQIQYFAPGDLGSYQMARSDRDIRPEDLQPWPGYGTIKVQIQNFNLLP